MSVLQGDRACESATSGSCRQNDIPVTTVLVSFFGPTPNRPGVHRYETCTVTTLQTSTLLAGVVLLLIQALYGERFWLVVVVSQSTVSVELADVAPGVSTVMVTLRSSL